MRLDLLETLLCIYSSPGQYFSHDEFKDYFRNFFCILNLYAIVSFRHFQTWVVPISMF
jgi:hypothetical protein